GRPPVPLYILIYMVGLDGSFPEEKLSRGKGSPIDGGGKMGVLAEAGRDGVAPAKPWDFQHVKVEVRSPLAQVVMNRPQKRNALSVQHMEELTEAFQRLGARKDVHV